MTNTSKSDIRYQCLTTSLSILLFLSGWYFHSVLSKTVYMASDLDMELPLLTIKLINYPLLTLLILFGMMCSTILCAWFKRMGSIGAVISAVSLLIQGIAVILISFATKLPWFHLMESFNA